MAVYSTYRTNDEHFSVFLIKKGHSAVVNTTTWNFRETHILIFCIVIKNKISINIRHLCLGILRPIFCSKNKKKLPEVKKVKEVPEV
jgi:hypothetical protein